VNAFHNSAISSFANALSQALCHLDKDGRLTAENARTLRQTIAEIPKELRLGGVVELDKYFQPFESLPVEAQHARMILEEAIYLNHRREPWNRYSFLVKERKGLFQSYVRSQLLPGRRLYIIRAHVFISPIGIKFHSAHRVVSERAVPGYLSLGVVHDPLPYIVNYSLGSKYDIIPPEEETAVKAAALAVPRGLAWAATYGFQTMAA
jgi:hypothetical protein